jgi:hypothetical protein
MHADDRAKIAQFRADNDVEFSIGDVTVDRFGVIRCVSLGWK